MNKLTVILDDDIYSTGKTLTGNVTCSGISKHAKLLSIRLIWFTQGKGDRDYATADSVDVELSEAYKGTAFEFILPTRPLSFSGKLISLTWAVEAVVKPSNQSALAEFALTDGTDPIVLDDKSNQLKELGMSRPFFSARRHA